MTATAEREVASVELQIPRRWLILAHAFNMDGRAESQTVTDKIPHLLKQGVYLRVVSSIRGQQDRYIAHRNLLPWGPAGLWFDFRHWLAQRVGRGSIYRLVRSTVSVLLAPFIAIERLALGLSSQWSWSIPAALHGIRLVNSGQVELIYSTGGAWSAHLAGWWIKRLTGALWIAEIYDPLVAPGEQPKTREAKAKRWLETKICTDADLAWWFTEAALASALRRNPQLADRGFAVLQGAAQPHVKAEHVYGDTLNIGHFGMLSSSRSLKPLLEALAVFCAQNPQARSVIRLHVYGSALDRDSARAVKDLGLGDVLIAHGRLERDPVSGLSGRDQVLQRMHRSDVLLLLLGSGPAVAENIPSKLYEYLWTGRPVLVLMRDNAQLAALVRDGYVCATDDQRSIVQGLEQLWTDWRNRALPATNLPPVSVETAVATILQAVERVRTGPLIQKRIGNN